MESCNLDELYPGGDSHIKMTGGLLVIPLRGLKAVLVSRRLFSLKRSTAGALAGALIVLDLLRVKKISSHTHKTLS